MQNSGGPSLSNSQQMQERHSQIVGNQQSSETGSNARMDNNPKKRMLSQQQHQMVSSEPESNLMCAKFVESILIEKKNQTILAISTNAASPRARTTNSTTCTSTRSTNSNSSDQRKFVLTQLLIIQLNSNKFSLTSSFTHFSNYLPSILTLNKQLRPKTINTITFHHIRWANRRFCQTQNFHRPKCSMFVMRTAKLCTWISRISISF